MKKIFALLAGISATVALQAQQVRPATSGQIYNEIARLKNLTNVLYLAAHPDDENTRLLAYLANGQHINTAYLSLTRGDGGQNILGTEQGAALGLIRTHELLEARKLDGAGQYFTRAVDFGFSKNYKETFRHWNETQLAGDVVWVIRKFRPDVIITRFPPNEQAGHGQHAASAILAEDGFRMAGDKTKYPEQLEHYSAWQPKRLLFNSFRFGDRNTTSEDQFKLDVGQYSPVIGMGYGELAGISRSIHRSQGAGTPSTPGVQKEYFKLVAGEGVTNSLFDGIDITWGRVGRADIGTFIENILKQYDFNHPEKSLEDLLILRKEIRDVQDEYWREQKLEELDGIIMHTSGFMAELYTKQPETIAGANLPFTMRMLARAGMPVRVKYINWTTGDSTMNIRLKSDSLYTFERTIHIPDNTPVTEPYWLQYPATDGGHYVLSDNMLLGYPQTPNDLTATVGLEIGGEKFTVKVPLSYKKLDPVRGDIIEQLRIVPRASVAFTSGMFIADADGSVTTSVRVHPNKDMQNMHVVVFNDKMSASYYPLNLKKGIDTTIELKFTAAVLKDIKDDFYLSAGITEKEVQLKHSDLKRTQHMIQYDHLPTLQYFTNSSAKVLHRNWKVTAKRIAYVEGAGDLTDDILDASGLPVDVLKTADITAAKLKQYDAVITGIRIVNTDKHFPNLMPALMDYTRNGGTLIMQYNTLQDMSTTNFSPYPITLSSQRVTEEDAKIEFLQPQHRLLNYPNKITQEDFAGWVQERGLYFPTKWDDKYQPLFRMNDGDEKPLDGATLYAPYGKGHYVYTSLAFFRQLPAGNKGAIRLLMNMVSVGK
ncbi:MAG: PIG-L family deacetylase [Sphingobacteriales bacterium]|nr:MAG: PIG-L family deacetylase [Sphingobacteriales bacterium]